MPTGSDPDFGWRPPAGGDGGSEAFWRYDPGNSLLQPVSGINSVGASNLYIGPYTGLPGTDTPNFANLQWDGWAGEGTYQQRYTSEYWIYDRWGPASETTPVSSGQVGIYDSDWGAGYYKMQLSQFDSGGSDKSAEITKVIGGDTLAINNSDTGQLIQKYQIASDPVLNNGVFTFDVFGYGVAAVPPDGQNVAVILYHSDQWRRVWSTSVDGHLFVGDTTPSRAERLAVQGGVYLCGPAIADLEGTLQYASGHFQGRNVAGWLNLDEASPWLDDPGWGFIYMADFSRNICVGTTTEFWFDGSGARVLKFNTYADLEVTKGIKIAASDPAPAVGTMQYKDGHFQGRNETDWVQLDNESGGGGGLPAGGNVGDVLTKTSDTDASWLGVGEAPPVAPTVLKYLWNADPVSDTPDLVPQHVSSSNYEPWGMIQAADNWYVATTDVDGTDRTAFLLGIPRGTVIKLSDAAGTNTIEGTIGDIRNWYLPDAVVFLINPIMSTTGVEFADDTPIDVTFTIPTTPTPSPWSSSWKWVGFNQNSGAMQPGLVMSPDPDFNLGQQRYLYFNIIDEQRRDASHWFKALTPGDVLVLQDPVMRLAVDYVYFYGGTIWQVRGIVDDPTSLSADPVEPAVDTSLVSSFEYGRCGQPYTAVQQFSPNDWPLNNASLAAPYLMTQSDADVWNYVVSMSPGRYLWTAMIRIEVENTGGAAIGSSGTNSSIMISMQYSAGEPFYPSGYPGSFPIQCAGLAAAAKRVVLIPFTTEFIVPDPGFDYYPYPDYTFKIQAKRGSMVPKATVIEGSFFIGSAS